MKNYRVSSDQLSCIERPTIVYRATKKQQTNKVTKTTIRTNNHKTRSYNPRNSPKRPINDKKHIVYRATNLSCIERPTYRVSSDQLSCIERPTIVYRATNYRVSSDQACFYDPLKTSDTGTYPHPANHSLIFLNPHTCVRERARMHAHERQPFVRKLTSPRTSSALLGLRPALSGATYVATKFATLKKLIHFQMFLRLPSTRYRSFRPALGGLTRPYGLRCKGAAWPLPSSLRECASLTNAAIAAFNCFKLQKLLTRARYVALVAFSLVKREAKECFGFNIQSTAFGLSGVTPQPPSLHPQRR